MAVPKDKAKIATYERATTPKPLVHGANVEIVSFDHDNRGRAVAWVISEGRVYCVFADELRL